MSEFETLENDPTLELVLRKDPGEVFGVKALSLGIMTGGTRGYMSDLELPTNPEGP